ncbi:hypothetical protein Bca101_071474 [Brassica carinata]
MDKEATSKNRRVSTRKSVRKEELVLTPGTTKHESHLRFINYMLGLSFYRYHRWAS